jgi:uncharacterized protein
MEEGNAQLSDLPNRVRMLLERDFLVRDRNQDRANLTDWMGARKRRSDILSITLVLTTHCNFACEYCYQRDVFKRHSTLNHADLRRIDQWVDTKLSKLRPKALYLHLFGGEPLVNWKMVPATLNRIGGTARARDVEFHTFLITNGALLTQAVAVRLGELGVASVQLSLDGLGEIQDQRRKAKNGTTQADTILQNLLGAVNHVPIDCRINVDRHNIRHIPLLMERLASHGLQHHPNFTLNLEFVSPIAQPTHFSRRNTFDLDAGELGIARLWQKQHALGFAVVGHMPTEGACDQGVAESVAVMPRGRIYSCAGFLGRRDFVVGDVSREDYLPGYDDLLNASPWRQCVDCPYVPLCQGGCRMCAYVHSQGDVASIYCRKEFFDQCFPEFLRYRYHSRKM